MESEEGIIRHRFEKVKCGVECHLSREVLESLTLGVHHDPILEGMVIKLSATLIGNKVSESTYSERNVINAVRVYKNWWQHLLACTPLRGMAKYHEIHEHVDNTTHVSKYNVCPHIGVPDNWKHVEFLSSEVVE
jgi:hypothetical protein